MSDHLALAVTYHIAKVPSTLAKNRCTLNAHPVFLINLNRCSLVTPTLAFQYTSAKKKKGKESDCFPPQEDEPPTDPNETCAEKEDRTKRKVV